MNYILNKNKKIVKLYNHQFDFLDNFKDYININMYYDIYNTFNEINIKNIYNFIYIKWYLIKNKLNIKEQLLKKKDVYSKDEFNIIIKNFIKDDISLAIFIINTTIRYI